MNTQTWFLNKIIFACVRINWNDKVANMKEISDELNIGLDSMVFVDDDPVNIEYVSSNLSRDINQFICLLTIAMIILDILN